MKAIAVLLMLLSPALGMTASEYEDFTAWMAEDPTDNNTYAEGHFDCTAFASCLSANATRAGFPVLVAYVGSEKFPDGHAVNVVEVDGDYKFIEPQADLEVSFENSTIVIDDPTKDNPVEFMQGKNKIILSGNVLQKVMN